MSDTLEISVKEALEIFEYMKKRKQTQMIIDEEFMSKIYAWFIADYKPNYRSTFQHSCESCTSGRCNECVNFILNIDICDCKGAYHYK